MLGYKMVYKEQDYSLNAGRYVGVVIEDDNITEEEFKKNILSKGKILQELELKSRDIEKKIHNNINVLCN